MKFDYVCFSLTCEKCCYEIIEVLVPILHGVKFTNSSRSEIYGLTELTCYIIFI